MIPAGGGAHRPGRHYVLLVNDENKVEVRRDRDGSALRRQLGGGQGSAGRRAHHSVRGAEGRPGIEVKPELTEATPAPMDGATESGTAEAPPGTTKDMSGMAGGMSGTEQRAGRR